MFQLLFCQIIIFCKLKRAWALMSRNVRIFCYAKKPEYAILSSGYV